MAPDVAVDIDGEDHIPLPTEAVSPETVYVHSIPFTTSV